MKKIIYVTMLCLGLNSYSQNFEDNYKTDICACIEAKKNTQQLAEKLYNECFVKHMTYYAEIIDAQIKEEDKTKKFITGQKIRRELNQKFKYDLAYDCDVYVDIIERKKQQALQKMRSKKIDSSRINKLNETVAMMPHYSTYFNRGQFYYFVGDLNKAERDVKKSIEENPLNKDGISTPQESLLLALIYEEQKRYPEAINLYDMVNSKVINPSVELLKAIVYRKSKGYVLKTKVELEKPQQPVAAQKTKKVPTTTRRQASTKNQAPETELNKTSRARNTKTQTTTEKKDSITNLRGLFKLN